MQYERELIDVENGVPVATIEEVYVLRGAGGYGGVNQPVSAPMQPVPDRMADAVLDLPTFAQQAMLYRLNGDRNPLHIDPAIAKESGFDRPVLHGLSTRSEEHTSELQSLMHISYAVFCLKKKNTLKTI